MKMPWSPECYTGHARALMWRAQGNCAAQALFCLWLAQPQPQQQAACAVPDQQGLFTWPKTLNIGHGFFYDASQKCRAVPLAYIV